VLRNLGEALKIEFVVQIVTVDPTQYVIYFYTKRSNFVERKLNKFSPYIININYTYVSLYFVH